MLPSISPRFRARDILKTVVCNCCIDCINTTSDDSVDDDGSDTPSYVFRRPRRSHKRKRTPSKHVPCTDDTSPACVAVLVYNNTQYKCHDLVELERIIRTRIPELYDAIHNGNHPCILHSLNPQSDVVVDSSPDE